MGYQNQDRPRGLPNLLYDILLDLADLADLKDDFKHGLLKEENIDFVRETTRAAIKSHKRLTSKKK